MKKFFILTALAVVIFSSCKKEAMPSSQLSLNAGNVSASSTSTPFKFDFTGAQFPNSCTGQDMVALQGTGHVNQQFGGTQYHLEFNIDNVVCQAIDGTGPL